MGRLAIDGGAPVRARLLPYGRQSISDADVAAVVGALRSDWLTSGPAVASFESAFAAATGAAHATAVSNGTAALHAAAFALGLGPGDEVLVPAITFAGTSNSVVFQGATPVFTDVEPDTLLIDAADAARRMTARTRAIFAVDYAGQPADYDALRTLAGKLPIVADACHALGGSYRGRPVGTLGDISTFSLHPVKHVTAGEGGVVTTDDADLAGRARLFRNHGITSDHRERERQGSWAYEMVELGYNYRLTDVQCALAESQLTRLGEWVSRRRALAARYDAAFSDVPAIRPLAVRPGVTHAYHLYVVRLDLDRLRADRGQVFAALRAEGIGVNVHYLPVYLHPFYRERFGLAPGLCPVAEAAYAELLTLPLFPDMSDRDADDVVQACTKVTEAFCR